MNEHTLTEAVSAIDALLRIHPHVTVAIDGRCGSGKTTLAAHLQAHYGCPVIPMDHFFLRRSQRTAARLETPGENADHERFLAEVLLPLSKGEPFAYRPFDCSRMELAAPVTVAPGALTVIEGSYSCHPALWDHYDLHIFLTVDPAEQMRRITARNGAYAKVFQEKGSLWRNGISPPSTWKTAVILSFTPDKSPAGIFRRGKILG